MKTVIEFQRNRGTDYLSCLAVWTRLGRERGWNHQHAEAGMSVEDAKRLLKFWNPDGCVVNNDNLPVEIFEGIPTVFLNRDVESVPCGKPVVRYDERAIAELAARELLSHNLGHYAFVPDLNKSFWCRERETWFVKAIQLNFNGVSVFDVNFSRKGTLAAVRRIADWIYGLPHPLGVFAANDVMARFVADACRYCGVGVPSDVSIVGVDNDVYVCETAEPTLSSVAFDEKAVPEHCYDLLDAMMSGQKVEIFDGVLIEPSRLVRRASTMRYETADAEVVRAMDTIRLKACEGVSAAQVADMFSCGRRMAEKRFRRVVGKSILDAIIDVRLERARELLAAGTMTQSAIANHCGYSSWMSLYTHLRSRTIDSCSQ